MAIVIEQDPARVGLSASLQVRAELVAARLISLNVASILNADKSREPINRKIWFNLDSYTQTDRRLSLTVEFKLELSDSSTPKPEKVFHLSCLFQASYELNPGFEPSPEQIDAFGEANAIFNLWPFFRELSQNTMARAGIQHEPVPFLRMLPKRPQEANPQPEN